MIVLYVLLAIAILLVMVIIHEFGHYLAGKILKFKINEFSVGFGPKLLSKKKKNGEVFSLRLIPLGGFCAFEGETDVEEKKPQPIDVFSENEQTDTAEKVDTVVSEKTEQRSFIQEKPWKRIIVLLAGGVFNLLSAVFFSFLFILIVGYATPHVDTVYSAPDTQSPYCLLESGDEIVKVNGKSINVMHSFEDYAADIAVGDQATVTVIRNGEEREIKLIKQEITIIEEGEEHTYAGFGFQSYSEYGHRSFGDALLYCVPFTAKLSWSILGSFFDLITGKIAITTLSGPVGTVSMMASVSRMNWRNIFILLPLIASNLGLFNLLPIPALDGSKVVFTLIEWIRGKPINRKVENYIHTIGLIALFAFVIVVDIIGMILR